MIISSFIFLSFLSFFFFLLLLLLLSYKLIYLDNLVISISTNSPLNHLTAPFLAQTRLCAQPCERSAFLRVSTTPCALPPESLEYTTYTRAGDVWALGCLLYRTAFGRDAFETRLGTENLRYYYPNGEGSKDVREVIGIHAH